ncbi:MAG: DUF58 domain-containing protein [Gemmatimonadaceae bacterium]|nr:DUF58 domain-containing protein [Gemmatimonadaceae bacterium]
MIFRRRRAASAAGADVAQPAHPASTAPAALVAPASAGVLAQVRRLELRVRRLVDSRFAGEYRSVYKGQGMEFSDLREYQPGDEVRSIDWNVTARLRRPFIKQWVEERELSVLLVLDRSPSAHVATRGRLRDEVALEASAILALAALRNNDRVGLVAFTDRVEHALPPKKGRRHGLRVLRDLLLLEPTGRGTDLALACEQARRHLAHRGLVFLLSDFDDPRADAALQRLATRHEVVAITVTDPADEALPAAGVVTFEDAESGERVEVDTDDAAFRARYAAAAAAREGERVRRLRECGVHRIALRTDAPVIEPLLAFFRQRRAGRRAIASLLAFALLLGARTAVAQSADATPPTPAPVRLGVRLVPETVTVGAPFTVRARVALPATWRVVQPPEPDTGGTVEPLDPPLVRDSVQGGERVTDISWRFLAWQPGTHAVPVASLLLRDGSVTRELPVQASIVVRSMLPADTARRQPRPARAPIDAPVRWWPRVALAIAVLLLLGILAWVARRVLRARRERAARPRTPLEVADAAFARLVARDLPATGEARRHVALAGEILRDFLGARLGLPASLATGEAMLVSGPAVGVHGEALGEFLARVDRVRFSTDPVSVHEARALVDEARRLARVLDERARSPRATPLALERIA